MGGGTSIIMIFPDKELHNADWTKRTWDLSQIKSKRLLLQYLSRHNYDLEDFKKLPIYQYALQNKDMEWLKNL